VKVVPLIVNEPVFVTTELVDANDCRVSVAWVAAVKAFKVIVPLVASVEPPNWPPISSACRSEPSVMELWIPDEPSRRCFVPYVVVCEI